jgi:hypothetical protein
MMSGRTKSYRLWLHRPDCCTLDRTVEGHGLDRVLGFARELSDANRAIVTIRIVTNNRVYYTVEPKTIGRSEP